ncbi:hypothetical protein TNCV_3590001 [Trichonephila clavipes]|nr:hypothetical protein TNCV_3590001 [Trichonephila clavipes]
MFIVSAVHVDAGLSTPWNGCHHMSQHRGVHRSTSSMQTSNFHLYCPYVSIHQFLQMAPWEKVQRYKILRTWRPQNSPIQRPGYAISSQSRTGAQKCAGAPSLSLSHAGTKVSVLPLMVCHRRTRLRPH